MQSEMDNKTNETYVPLSRGLAEHLKRLSGPAIKVYIWLLIRAKFKGNMKGKVVISFRDLAAELDIHYMTAYKACQELRPRYIDYKPSRSRWKETIFTIKKYKNVDDFTFSSTTKGNFTFSHMTKAKGKGKSKNTNSNNGKGLRKHNNVEECINNKGKNFSLKNKDFQKQCADILAKKKKEIDL